MSYVYKVIYLAGIGVKLIFLGSDLTHFLITYNMFIWIEDIWLSQCHAWRFDYFFLNLLNCFIYVRLEGTQEKELWLLYTVHVRLDFEFIPFKDKIYKEYVLFIIFMSLLIYIWELKNITVVVLWKKEIIK